ncbi:MAG: cysteine--tRNA ligase [Bacteroidetes bacterium]|nr:cysteine--tRNA ligase [Bacteroidota bacterium]
MKIYNSLTRQLELFEPINPPYVGLYVCGPTVSGESHLGHARPYITFDVLNRYLTHLGHKVRYVRNITDAGHFEEEGRDAEDKINSKAILERLEPMELVQKYTNLYHWAMHQFNCIDPSIEPTATGHIIEQIDMIQKIIADGYAYEVNGSVYFDVEKYNTDFSKKGIPYGILSGRNLEDQLESTRELDNQEEKRNRSDFALWKSAPASHLMRWTSPWGDGFPGWHIECSTMSSKYLGKQFDIHGGGMDLQFPHHECEIAQSAVVNGHIPAKYWMHNNMITINGKKMGKSYNNVLKLTEMFSGEHELLEQPYSPMTIRFFILQTHYRSTLDFGNEPLQAAEKGLKRLMSAYEVLMGLDANQFKEGDDADLNTKINNLLNSFDEALDEDLNTAKVLSYMFEIIPTINGIKGGQVSMTAVSKANVEKMKKYFSDYIEHIFGLTTEKSVDNDKLAGVMQVLLDLRSQAKANKDFATSDLIRKQIEALGIVIKDSKEGTTWSLN